VKKAALILLVLMLAPTSRAQETLTLKYFGLAIHPFGDKTAHLQPNKLDEKARFVLNFGLFVGYEKFLYEDLFSVKAIQSITSDCSNGLASISHLGLRLLLMKTKKHRVYFGIGPTLIMRDSWTRFGDDYESSGFFNEYTSQRLGEIQWKFIPYAFEFEYDYVFSDKNQLSVSFTPAVPAMTLAVGWKHWFNLKTFDRYKLYSPKKRKK
jgi:hypothetical protein